MAKKQKGWLTLVLILILPLLLSLACSLFEGEEGEDDPAPDIDTLISERERAAQRIENLSGLQEFDVDESGTVIKDDICDPGYPAGENVPVEIDYLESERSNIDAIRIVDQSEDDGFRIYTKWSNYIYCRETIRKPSVAREFHFQECIEFTGPHRFELRVYDNDPSERKPCYTAVYSVSPDLVVDGISELPLDEDAEDDGTAVQAPESTVEVETDPEVLEQDPSPFFTKADCSCRGIDSSANLENASASPLGTKTPAWGSPFENVERLSCRWIESYSSDQKKGAEIWMDLEVFKLANEEDGRSFFEGSAYDILEHLPDCEQYGDCTVAVAEHTEERAFYVVKSVFIRGDGVQFPSSHYAWMARLTTSAEGESFVSLIDIVHPELDNGSSWAVATVDTLDNCAVDLVTR